MRNMMAIPRAMKKDSTLRPSRACRWSRLFPQSEALLSIEYTNRANPPKKMSASIYESSDLNLFVFKED